MIDLQNSINTDRIYSIRSPTNREYKVKQLFKQVGRPYSIMSLHKDATASESRSRNVLKLNKYHMKIRLNTEESTSNEYTKESIFTLSQKSLTKLSRTPALPCGLSSMVLVLIRYRALLRMRSTVNCSI